MKVLVTGAGGQLGRPLVAALRSAGHAVEAFDRARCDLRDGAATEAEVRAVGAELVVHAAAMTAVDACELEPERAEQVNAAGTEAVCRGARASGARVIYISTDYVFSGDDPAGYDESAVPAPRSVYGRTKRAGEVAVLAVPSSLVVRVSWLFGPDGPNFVAAILARARSGAPLSIVDDQRGVPTYAPDLAARLAALATQGAAGVLHLTSGDEAVSWYDFGCAAIAAAGLEAGVARTSTEAFGRPAPRPACSVLRSRRRAELDLDAGRPWRLGLEDYLSATDSRVTSGGDP